jgi:predicted DNA-binding transcriptional regulator AlpA
MEMKEGDYIHIKQLAPFLNVSLRTLRNWIKAPVNPLPCYKVQGLLLFKTCEVEEWIQRHKVTTINVTVKAREILKERKQNKKAK